VSFLLAKTNEVGLRVAENTNNLAVLLHFLQVLFNDSLAFWLSPFLSVSRECLLLGASPSDKEVRMAHARLKLISNCERSFNPLQHRGGKPVLNATKFKNSTHQFL
jgi:hypothetical protein